jgi:hypothetical protein
MWEPRFLLGMAFNCTLYERKGRVPQPAKPPGDRTKPLTGLGEERMIEHQE